jgi:integral membrane protein (TIGR01906 family)
VIVVVTLVGGVAGMLLFDQAFILFHEIFFPGGNYLFDPRTDRLVQLFPQQFWVDSTIGVGAVVIAVAVLVALVGRRRRTRLAAG